MEYLLTLSIISSVKLVLKKIDVKKDALTMLSLDQRIFSRPFNNPCANIEEMELYIENSFAYICFNNGRQPIGFFAYEPHNDNEYMIILFGVILSFQQKKELEG